MFFFLNVPATTEIYTLSLHDALPISARDGRLPTRFPRWHGPAEALGVAVDPHGWWRDRKSTRLNSSHANISYAVFCLKKKKKTAERQRGAIHTAQEAMAPHSSNICCI